MRAAELTQAYRYQIDGVEGAPDRRWNYVGSIDGVARFVDSTATAVMLDLDQLVVLGPAHLQHKS